MTKYWEKAVTSHQASSSHQEPQGKYGTSQDYRGTMLLWLGPPDEGRGIESVSRTRSILAEARYNQIVYPR